MFRVRPALCLALLSVACGEAARELEVGTSSRALVQSVTDTYFYPPLGPNPPATGTFDSTLLPRIRFVLESFPPNGAATTVGTFAATTTPAVTIGASRYRVFLRAGTYFTNSSLTYRVRVSLDGRELGFADVPAQIFSIVASNPNFMLEVAMRTDLRPVPSISSVSPQSAPAGGAAFTLSVSGTNLSSDSVIRFAGQEYGTRSGGAGVLLSDIPSAAIASAGDHAVTIFTPNPGGGESSVVNFAVLDPAAPQPVASSIEPSTVPAGEAATLTVRGSSFVERSVVLINGGEAPTTFVSSTELRAELLSEAGFASVVVRTAAPGGGDSETLVLSVLNPRAVVSGLSPSSAIAGGADLEVSVDGASFTSGAIVLLDGAPLATTFVSSNLLTVLIPAAQLAVGREALVTVENPEPSEGTSDAVTFVIGNPAPVVSSLSAVLVAAGSNALTLTVSGNDFVSGAVVSFAGTAVSTTFQSPATLVATVPSDLLAAAGTFDVLVTNPAPSAGSSAPQSVRVVAGGVGSVAGGGYHTCVLISDGTVNCAGDNVYSQLGRAQAGTDWTIPAPVTQLSNVVELSAGTLHTCARLTDATVRCWGYGYAGELGHGQYGNASTPVIVTGLSNVAELSMGSGSSYARTTDGAVWSWGANQYGQLGDGTTTRRNVARVVPGINAIQIAAGFENACALLANRTVRCWGRNNYGQLGDGTTTNRLNPVQVSGLTDVAILDAHGPTTCAVLMDGTARCWGRNDYGQVGDGTTTQANTPRQVSGLSNIAGLTAQAYAICVRLVDGTARCWGSNAAGEVGDGTTTTRLTPVPVVGLSNVRELVGAILRGFAILDDGTVLAWGNNYFGEFGNGTRTSPGSLVPVVITF